MLTPRSIPGEVVSPRILRHAPSCYILVTKEFLDSLHKEKELPYVNRLINLLSELGYNLKRPHADMLEDGIYELRIRLQHRQFRILYFYFFQDKIILSHGLKKDDKKVKTAEIEKAKRHKLDYFSKHERRK